MWRPVCLMLFAYLAVRTADGAMTIEQMEKAAKGLRTSCVGKTNANEELVLGIRKGEFADDQNVRCYTLCIMKKLRTFKNGQVDVDVVQRQVEAMMPAENHERLKAAAAKCGSEAPSEDQCVTAFNYVKCNYETDPDVFFFP